MNIAENIVRQKGSDRSESQGSIINASSCFRSKMMKLNLSISRNFKIIFKNKKICCILKLIFVS